MGVQGIRDGLHAGDPDRHLHGVVRRSLRRVLQFRSLRSLQSPHRTVIAVADLEEEVLARIERQRKLRPRFRDNVITMAHGAGGKATHTLVAGLFAQAFANDALAEMADAARVEVGSERLAVTTDAFVVKPLRFPGGSIGELAVNGTLNDLAVSGARPLAITAAFVIEEGLAGDVLRAEVQAMAAAGARAEVPIVAGDTKVVEFPSPPRRYDLEIGFSYRGRSEITAPPSCSLGESSSWTPMCRPIPGPSGLWRKL